MFIPNIDSVFKRDVAGDVRSTAQAFRSWDTCMADRPCKIIAIVLIVLGCLIVMWALSTVIRCMCLGFSCLEALCCCCCRSASKEYHEKQVPYNNPNMYMPPAQPIYHQNGYAPPNQAAGSVYDTNTTYYGNNRNVQTFEPSEPSGYQVVDDPFSDRKGYRGNNF